MLRRVLLPLLVVCAAAAFAPGAFAANPSCTPVQPQLLSSAHFAISFNDDPNNAGAGPAITQRDAGKVLADAEQAYSAMTAMGFPAPVTSGGKTQIHVIDLSSFNLASYNCFANIDFDANTITNDSQTAYSAAFDVFEEIEWNYGSPDGWLIQGAAAWAAWKSLGYPEGSTSPLGPWSMSLDCDSTVSLTSKLCDPVGYINDGESRWPFYEFLTEKYGNAFIKELLQDVQTAGDEFAGLNTALGAHGSSLTGAYNEFAARLVKGGWSTQALNLVTPTVSGAPIQTGVATGDVSTQTFGVDHLATRIVQIDRGDGSGAHACYTATLKLTVTIPSGITSQPTFIWNKPGTASIPLTVSGTTATATVPWDTCTWTTHGYLALPNTSTDVNGALFTVAMHLDVTTTEVTAKPPSVPANGYGNATDVGSAQVAPLISVFGPLVLRLPSTATRLRLVVEANAQGAVHATLGSSDLGVSNLVPGTNVVSFNLPAGLLRTLRTTSTANNVLTLSPVSQDGQVSGTARTMTVVVETPAKTKPKKKPKK